MHFTKGQREALEDILFNIEGFYALLKVEISLSKQQPKASLEVACKAWDPTDVNNLIANKVQHSLLYSNLCEEVQKFDSHIKFKGTFKDGIFTAHNSVTSSDLQNLKNSAVYLIKALKSII